VSVNLRRRSDRSTAQGHVDSLAIDRMNGRDCRLPTGMVAAMLKSPPLITVRPPISHWSHRPGSSRMHRMATQAVSAERSVALFRIGRMVADSRRNRKL